MGHGQQQASHEEGHGGTVVHLPSIPSSLRHSLRPVLEGVLGPFLVFYLVLTFTGFRGALIAGLAWAYAALIHRLLRRQRPPATLVIATVLLTVRTAIAFVTSSSILYFAQPSAATGAVALVFLFSAVVRRPLTQRLAQDFCPLDPAVLERPAVRRFFIQISVLWGAVLLSNAGFALWLLLTASLRAFVVERAALSWSLTVCGIVLSTVWFVRSMRRAGISVHWGGRVALAHVAPGEC